MIYEHGKKFESEELKGIYKDPPDDYPVPGYEQNAYELHALLKRKYQKEDDE